MKRLRKHLAWVASTLVVLSIAAGLAWRATVIRRDVERWETYQRNCHAAGEDLSVASWQPPDVAVADNLMTHPWMVEFASSESSDAALAVDKIRPWPGLGLDEYEAPAEGKSWFDGREAETLKVIETGHAQARHLAAIHEAARRPGCRMLIDFNQYSGAALNEPSMRVARLSEVLAMQADAAMAYGDGEVAAEHLIAMFQLGNHLRSQNFLLASIIGAGFEKRAAEVAEVGLDRHVFSDEARARILASIRSRPVEVELVSVMKVERAWFLKLMTLISANPPTGRHRFTLRNLFHSSEREAADNALFFCKVLEPALRKPSREAWEKFNASLQKINKADSTHGLAVGPLFAIRGVIPVLFLYEDDLIRLRAKLAE